MFNILLSVWRALKNSIWNTASLPSFVPTIFLRAGLFTPRLRDQRSKWMQDGCTVYLVSYMALNGSCFMVTWTILKNHHLEVGLTQNQEVVALQNLTTVDLLYFIMCDLTWLEIHWNIIWWREWSHMASHYTWGPMTTLHDFGNVSGCHVDISFGLSRFHGHGSWLVCEVALRLQWRGVLVKNFRGMEQYDWLQTRFFTKRTCTTSKTSPVKKFEHGRKNDMDADKATLCFRGVP